MYQQHMLLKLRKVSKGAKIRKRYNQVPHLTQDTIGKVTYFEIYTKHWLSFFRHLNLPISIKIPVTLWKIVYIYMTTISPNLIS